MMLSYGLHPQGCRPYRSFVSAGVYPSVNVRVNPSVTALCAAPPPLSGEASGFAERFPGSLVKGRLLRGNYFWV